MGDTYVVELFCVKEMVDGTEEWGWETIYRGSDLGDAVLEMARKKQETDGAVRLTWR